MRDKPRNELHRQVEFRTLLSQVLAQYSNRSIALPLHHIRLKVLAANLGFIKVTALKVGFLSKCLLAFIFLNGFITRS